jgi:hypothetical protein
MWSVNAFDIESRYKQIYVLYVDKMNTYQKKKFEMIKTFPNAVYLVIHQSS